MIPFPIGYYQQQAGGGFDPSQIPDILYWLNFTDATKVTTSGGEITYMTDSIGNWDFNQGGSSFLPKYLNDGTYNFARFDENPSLRSVNKVLIPPSNQVSVFFVAKLYDDFDGDNGIILESSTNAGNVNDAFRVLLNTTGNPALISYFKDGQASQTYIDFNTPDYGILYFHVCVFDKPNGVPTSRTRVYQNDSLPIQNNQIVGTTGTGNFGEYYHWIGDRSSGGTLDLFADMYEIGLINRAIDLTEVQQIFNDYVNPKYGII